MLTSTARKHIVSALRQALRINQSDAAAILNTTHNWNALTLIDGPMHGVTAVVGGCRGDSAADLYRDNGQGYEFIVSLTLSDDDVRQWNNLPLEEAHVIGAEVFRNRRKDVADVRDFANDDDLLPEEEMDKVFGPVPESREWNWTNGKVVRADIASSDDHVVALVELADGARQTMAMFPLSNNPADLLSYVSGKIGLDARLCVGRVTMFDMDVPAGFDRSMPVLDMIVPQHDVPGIVRLYSRAA